METATSTASGFYSSIVKGKLMLCPDCRGSGFYEGLTKREACRLCGGSGSSLIDPKDFIGLNTNEPMWMTFNGEKLVPSEDVKVGDTLIFDIDGKVKRLVVEEIKTNHRPGWDELNLSDH
jgi:hypothetical protein